jgi:D-alanyl-D-alanine carboxypeptidase
LELISQHPENGSVMSSDSTTLLAPRPWRSAIGAIAILMATPVASLAEALLVVDAETGRVVHAENATQPWYPASVTKIMTAYVTLRAVKERRISLDTLFTVSPTAAAQQPSKMGFRAGIQVTVDNALKMMMVKSANDMAVVLAEGVSGSVEKFADEMNRTARRLGMLQSNFVNPNGLPAEQQITSARDLAILARAVIRDLPEYEYFMSIPAIKFGRRVTRNFNSLIGRYPGADGMKTGFICASGFNLVASATRDGKRMIAVVLGSPSSAVRAVKAAQLLERGFGGNGLSWLVPSLGSVEALQPLEAAPPNLRDEMCGPNRKRPAADNMDEEDQANANGAPGLSLFSGLRPQGPKSSELLGDWGPIEPVVVYIGPKRDASRVAATDEGEKSAKSRRKLAAKPKGAAPKDAKDSKDAKNKPQASTSAKTDAKTDAKPNAEDAGKSQSGKPAQQAKLKKQDKPDAKPQSGAATEPADRKKKTTAARSDKPGDKD